VFLPSASLICPLSTPVFICGPSSTRRLCTVFVSRPFSLFPLYYVFVSERSSPNPICTMFFNCDLCFLCFNPDHTLYSVSVLALSTICQLYSVLLCSSATPLLCTRIIASSFHLLCFKRTISSSPPLLGCIIQRIPSLLFYALLS